MPIILTQTSYFPSSFVKLEPIYKQESSVKNLVQPYRGKCADFWKVV